MPDKETDKLSGTSPVGTGATGTAPGLNRGQRTPDVDSGSGDPFIDDMTAVAGHTVMDGNAQVDSPQAITNSDGSPGNSR